jgi:DNA-binding CsgD family transcriptional regulator
VTDRRKPITQEEREVMRERRAKGASLEEIAAEFSCSPITTRKICSNVLPRKWDIGKPISQEKIDQIVAYRMQGRTQSDIARMVGVSLNVVTRYTPPELKVSRSKDGEGRKRIRWAPERKTGGTEIWGSARWTAAEEKQLFDMLQEGRSRREIAIKLDRAYVSVKDKINRISRCGEDARVNGVVAWRPIPPDPDLKHDPMLIAIEKEKQKTGKNRVKCLKCLILFDSYDPRRNRICVRCKGNEDWK